jgi:hypothetical protein
VPTETLHVAFYENRLDNQPKLALLTWEKLALRLTQHREQAQKDGPLWSPAQYPPGQKRANNSVLGLTAAVADFDNGTAWEEVQERLSGYEYVAHSTYSSDPEHPKFRVVIPFSQPVGRVDWPGIKARIDHHVFGLANDPAAKDASRAYYLPSCPPEALRFAERHEGRWLDPRALPEVPARERNNGTGKGGATGLPLGKDALDFVANGAPILTQRPRALRAARNYLGAGYSIEDATAAIWRGLQVSPQQAGKPPWTEQDAADLVYSIANSDPPPIEFTEVPCQASAMAYLEAGDEDGCRVRRSGMGYSVEFPSDKVTISVDHLRRSSGELRAEVLVEASLPAIPKHVYWGGLILSSGPNREKMARTLAKRTPGHLLDWDGILEVMCRKVAVAERQGEPFVTAGDMPERLIESDWLITGYAPRLESTTIFGDGGVGKSMLCLALALSIQTGVGIVPGFSPAVKGRVLYLDWEASRQRLDTRIKRLCRGVDIDPVCIGYRRCTLPLVDQVEEILRYCQNEGIVAVVVDSVEMAMNGTGGDNSDPNDKVRGLYSALRFLNASNLLVDHVSAQGRSQKEGAGKAIGGVFKQNLARMVFELRKATDGQMKGQLNLGLFNLKRNDDGPLLGPVGLRVEFSPDSTRYFTDGLSDTALLAGLPVKDRLIALLKTRGQANNSDLKEWAWATRTSVDTALSRGQGSVFTKLPNGNWGLLVRSDAQSVLQAETPVLVPEEIPW